MGGGRGKGILIRKGGEEEDTVDETMLERITGSNQQSEPARCRGMDGWLYKGTGSVSLKGEGRTHTPSASYVELGSF